MLRAGPSTARLLRFASNIPCRDNSVFVGKGAPCDSRFFLTYCLVT